MRDWKQYVRANLRLTKLTPAREAEIVEDLALQLDDIFQAALRRGATSEEADAEALQHIPDFSELARAIESGESRNTEPRIDREIDRLRQNSRPGGRGAIMFADLTSDIVYGLRTLRKTPGFTVVAVITLALGIGLNTAIFSLVNAVLFKPLPVQKPEELVGIYDTEKDNLVTHVPVAYPDFRDFAEQSRSFQGMSAYALARLALDQGNESEMVSVEVVSGNYFSVLGVKTASGRTFLPEDGELSAPRPVVVLSYASWQRRFGSDPRIVGRTIRFNGNPLTVIGVAEPSFPGMVRGIPPEAWVPIGMLSPLHATSMVTAGGGSEVDRLRDRHAQWVFAIGRLRPGVTRAQAQAELETIAGRLRAEYPDSNRDRHVALLAASDVKIFPGLDGVLYTTSYVLLAVVGLVLLIAAANVANMMLVRATSRRKEIAVRIALGAGHWRLVRQLLTESLLLALAGGALGLLLARWSNAAVTSVKLPIPVRLDLGLDIRVFAFTMLVSTLTAVVFGITPALQASKVDAVTALKEESRTGSGSHGRKRLRNVLVVAQVSLSLVLLIAAGLSVRSMQNAGHTNPGFEPDGMVVMKVSPGTRGYTKEQGEIFYRRLSERVRATPGVESAAMTSHLPLVFDISVDSGVPQGSESLPTEQWTDIDTVGVSPDYFAAMRIPMVSGREFGDQDTEAAPLRAVVNELLAQRFWPGQDPIGRKLILGSKSKKAFEVIGVARNGKYRTLGEGPIPFLYTSVGQSYESGLVVIARAHGDSHAVLAGLREAVRQLDERVPVTDLQSMDEEIGSSLLLPRMSAALFGLFGILGLVLASVGLYGVIAYTVGQRTHEIGIRVAVGAQRTSILRLVVSDGMLLTLIGVALGLTGAFLMTRVIRSVLIGISPADPLTFIAVSALLAGVALVACLIPARRAMNVDPIVALRYE